MPGPRPFPLLLLLALAACTPPAAGPAAGTNAVAAATPAPAAPPPPLAPPPPAPARVTSAYAWSGGVTTPLATQGETTVEPASSFRVELPASVPDARLSLLDASEALVTGTGERSVGAATTLTFKPEAPLQAGGRYRLRLDGAATRELHQADGTVALPVEWPVAVAGEPPADRARPARKRKR